MPYARHRLTLALAITLATVVALVIWWFPSPRMKPEPRFVAPTALPEPVRALLHQRMLRHGAQLSDLGSRVVTLDFERAAELAEAIVGDASLARPTGEDASLLNARVPTAFFDLQDELRRQGQRVAASARAHDAEALSVAWAETTRACVRCHAIYLSPSP